MGAPTSLTPRYQVGGIWLDSITSKWAHDSISWGFPEGDVACSWSMQLGLTRPPALSDGAIVQAYLGPMPLWRGTLVAPDWSSAEDGTMSFSAQGDAAGAYQVPALSASGMTTSRPQLAAAQAVARGEIGWLDTSSLPNTPYTDPTSSPSGTVDETADLNYLGTLLDAYAIENTQEWGVHNGIAYMYSRPTIPTWYLDPAAGVLGTTQEALAAKLFGRYLDSGSGTLKTISVGSGSPVALIDLTPSGAISATRATTKLNGMLAKTGAKVGWTNGFTVTTSQIRSGGGVHPHLGLVGSSVATGTMARLHGTQDPRGIDMGINVVIGTAEWHPADGTLDLNPVDFAGADLGTLAEKVGGALVS